VLEFFRFHSAGHVGKKGLYPSAVLFRELSLEQKDRLLKRTQRWPDALAKQVAKTARPEWYRNDLQAGSLDFKVGRT
jgi:hypothetical protein